MDSSPTTSVSRVNYHSINIFPLTVMPLMHHIHTHSSAIDAMNIDTVLPPATRIKDNFLADG
jgi:hypothetical protein